MRWRLGRRGQPGPWPVQRKLEDGEHQTTLHWNLTQDYSKIEIYSLTAHRCSLLFNNNNHNENNIWIRRQTIRVRWPRLEQNWSNSVRSAVKTLSLTSILFLSFLSGFMDVYSQWRLAIMISSGIGSHTDDSNDTNMSFMSVCFVLTEL